MPRRLFVPFECIRGRHAASMLKQISRSTHKLVLYWLQQLEADDGKMLNNWHAAEVTLNGRIPRDLWENAVTFYSFPAMLHKDPTPLENGPSGSVDLNLVVGGVDDSEVGLSIAWNPKSQKEIGCLLVSEELPDLTAEGPLVGRNLLFIHVPKIALLAVPQDATYPATPPDSYEPLISIWEFVGWKDTRWQLRPKSTLFYVEKIPQSRQSSSVLAVDFGTSCSTAALLNVRDSTDVNTSPVGLVKSPILGATSHTFRTIKQGLRQGT